MTKKNNPKKPSLLFVIYTEFVSASYAGEGRGFLFMKQLLNVTRKALINSRGASLIEAIVSILVFTVLIATVTMILTTSMRISSTASSLSYEMQYEINAVTARDEAAIANYPGHADCEDCPAGGCEVVLVFGGFAAGEVRVPVDIFGTERFISFEP